MVVLTKGLGKHDTMTFSLIEDLACTHFLPVDWHWQETALDRRRSYPADWQQGWGLGG